ncbi:ATPase [Sorangium cellulosum]|uniref:histidine kinase n=1 Tax=Sorangium cellulosum TaxID=56 RepID=A0A2L0EP94_SORCE|nr:ATP-binding sensor histidine kinase [Sorangium cellulosum]AUX41119.1 ATPase [Sorangium cellulosum]
MSVPGYTLTKILHRGAYTVAHRIAGEAGTRILRRPRDPLRRSDVAKLRHEHQILASLGGDPELRLVETPARGAAYVIAADPGGELLRSLLPGPLPVATALWIGIGLVGALAALHQKRILHKDVNPDNVLVDERACKVSLLCHALASRIPRETHRIISPEFLEGSLAYISPEQTGRMNRAIDYRADFYSLGITLYEMLTGQPPFAATDPAELVHAHIARMPAPPHEVTPGVPQKLSALVMKLLAKNAEDRYQSCHGIRADLEACAAQLAAYGRIEHVALGAHDIPDVLHVPQKLYGREREVESLMEAFERASRGRPELVLISGYSGIGKSSVIHEIHRPIVRAQGFFIAGKYEQYKRDIPYFALTRAFQGLLRQILTGSRQRVAEWRARLVAALGPHGRIITDVIPEVEIIIGEQPPVVEASPAESQARFREVFQRFVQVFAQLDHPLVLFLDDLQWADTASLNLIRGLLESEGSHYLLLVGAYRDNEVDPTHPLLATLDEVRRSGVRMSPISLAPLSPEHVTALVSDTLRCDVEATAPLARLLVEKTGGNPFFLLQFLQSLHEDRLLEFDREAQRWRWNAADIRRMPGTENVVDLMAGKLQRLPQRTRDVLTLAACVGNQFDLTTLSVVMERPRARTAADLLGAVREGLILPLVDDLDAVARTLVESTQGDSIPDDAEGLSVSYRFLHDRVQQAAYSLITEEQRKAVHYKVGQLMLKDTSEDALPDRVFDIVHHFNLCPELLVDRETRARIAELNLLASDRAKDSMAYEVALKHALAGAARLGDERWETDYDLAVALTTRSSECEYLLGRFAEAERLFDVILSRSRTVLEKVKIHTLKTVLHRHNIRYGDAIEVAIAGLKLAGIDVPPPADAPGLLALAEAERRELDERMRGREIAHLIELPPMRDPLMLATMSLLEELSMLGMFFTPLLVSIATLRMVILSLQHGNARASAAAYATHGMIVGAAGGDYASGHAFGRLAIELSDKNNDLSAQCKTRLWFGAFINHYRAPLTASLAALKEGCDVGVRSGDPVWVAYSALFYQVQSWARGDHLDEIFVDPMWSLVNEFQSLRAVTSYRQAARSLRGATLVPGGFDDDTGFVDTEHEATIKREGLWLSFQHYCTAKIETLFYFERYQEALAVVEDARAAGDIEVVLFAQYTPTEFIFYTALLASAVYESTPAEERERHLATLQASLGKIRTWAENCPVNYKHKLELVSAEAARIAGRELEAIELYERALESARQNGFLNHHALAAELAARFHLARGRRTLASLYLGKARAAYARWGAAGKVRALDERYPDLDVLAPESEAAAGAALDLITVLKATQAISGEIVLEKLLAKMMQIIIENAGAQRGYFILERAGRLWIEAAGTVDGAATALQSVAVDEHGDLSIAVVNYVVHTGQQIVVDDAASDVRFASDPYIARRKPKSLLASPIVSKKQRVGILYLENNLATSAFNAGRLRVLELLSTQAAISLENALLYDTLEQRVQERTRELIETRNQLVAQEKLASLGSLTAGIAHEIRNPLNFVNNFALLSANLCDALAEEIEALRGSLDRNATDRIIEILLDLRSNSAKINQHGQRADGIVRAMLEHARGGGGSAGWSKVNKLVADHARLSLHGMRSRDREHAVRLLESYDPSLDRGCVVPHDIGRVILNLVNNAWYATRLKRLAGAEGYTPTIAMSTTNLGGSVEIRVRDNGNGIAEEVRGKIFTPFFTTKPAPDGVGLGLSLSHDIVAQRSGGSLRFESEPGEYAEFIVVLPKHEGAP